MAIDDASRLAFVEILPSLGQDDATAFLERALAWFCRIGVKLERVMTDNGSAYRSKRFAAALAKAGIRHVRTRPYTPRNQWQGRALHPDKPARVSVRQTICKLQRAPRSHRQTDTTSAGNTQPSAENRPGQD